MTESANEKPRFEESSKEIFGPIEETQNAIFKKLRETPILEALKLRIQEGPHAEPVTIVDDLPLCDVVQRLAHRKILSAPVINKDGAAVGMLGMLDIVAFIVAQHPDPEKLQKKDLETLQMAERNIAQTPAGQVLELSRGTGQKRQFQPLYEGAPLATAVEIFAQGVHRTPTFNDKKQITGILSQTDVLRWVARLLERSNDEQVKRMANTKLADYGYTCKGFEVYTVNIDSPVLIALQKLAATGVSGLAVVDREGKLRGNFSASDLRGLYQQKFPLLLSPVGDFLLEYSKDSLNPIVEKKETRTLLETIKDMVGARLHHVWVVDEHFKACGVVSMTDLLDVCRRSLPPLQPHAQTPLKGQKEQQPRLHEQPEAQAEFEAKPEAKAKAQPQPQPMT